MICDNCGALVKRNTNGAKYAEEWATLPEWHLKFLSWWLSNHPRDILQKDQMVKLFKYVGHDAINTRISELKALFLVVPAGKGYKLNLLHTVEVLNKGGSLLSVERVFEK